MIYIRCVMVRNSPAANSFEALMLPHRAAAYNLAFWLTGNADDAADVVQDAFLRALRFFEDYRGGSARAWLLTIVRHTSLNCLAQKRQKKIVSLVDPLSDDETDIVDERIDIELELIQKQAAATMDRLIQALPLPFREVMILREIEELSYQEIAEVTATPIGTVMSRLARARKALQKHWRQCNQGRAV